MTDVPAPELREVAEAWWDVERDPVLRWSEDRHLLELADPEGDDRLIVARFRDPVPDPTAVAHALAEGLAACDFPPTGDAASPSNVARALDAAGIDAPLAD